MEDVLCYIEDELGGLICYEEDIKAVCGCSRFTICCSGTKEEVEEYLGYEIEDYMIHKG